MTAVNDKPSTFVFKGWHMLVIMILFFGTIISVNLLMAWYASTSWSGLVVQNTYVASQEFNAKAASIRSMLATGIKAHLSVDGAQVRYVLTHPQIGPVDADTVTLHFKRPVGEHQDFVLAMTPASNGVFTGEHAVLPGQWIVEAMSSRAGTPVLHEAVRITVKGAVQ